MADQNDPDSAARCAALLQSVLRCLDRLSIAEPRKGGDTIALAAAHVQQAIELIQSMN